MTSKKLNISENVSPTYEAVSITKSKKEQAKELLNKFMEEETRLVKGIPQNFEAPGSGIPVNLLKYKGHFFQKILPDGVETEVPLYVARFLNGIDITATGINGKLGTCSFAVHSYILDKDGNPTVSTHLRKKRFGFQSLEFGGAVA